MVWEGATAGVSMVGDDMFGTRSLNYIRQMVENVREGSPPGSTSNKIRGSKMTSESTGLFLPIKS
jgi:hypothetical protein